MLSLWFVWCRHQESNSGPTDYKSVALPTELYRQNAVDLFEIRVRILVKYDEKGNLKFVINAGFIGIFPH